MKSKINFLIIVVLGTMLFTACEKDTPEGSPVMSDISVPSSAYFGDSIPFIVTVSDADYALSTLKVQLYFSGELVSSTTIRTKTKGTYTGKIYVPFYANIPDGTASLTLVLQDINFATTEETYDMPCQRPKYEYLTLVTEDGDTYTMTPMADSAYKFSVTSNFPQEVDAKIVAPAYGNYGNEITFGWSSDNAVSESGTDYIPFSNILTSYDISFNTLTYEASPFVTLSFDGVDMSMIDASNYKVEKEFTQGQTIEVTGIVDYDSWWIDPDFFTKNDDGTLTFLPVSGKYRVTANMDKKYFKCEAMDGDDLAALQSDGTGAIWAIGQDIGKPNNVNAASWDPENGGLCLSQITAKHYQLTLVAGTNINTTGINFKFFYQKTWGSEFDGSTNLTTTSDFIIVGQGSDVNGVGDGNIALVDGVTLEDGATYVFTIDVSAGIDAAVLTVEKK